MYAYGTEIKFTFAGDQAAAAVASFGLLTEDADRREIHFLDVLDPDGNPKLLGLGVVLRLRSRQEGAGDTTLKLRPAEEDRLTGRWRPEHQDDDYRVEYDWANRSVLSASLDAKIKAHCLADVVSGDRPPQHAFTEDQRDFLRACGPDLISPFRGLRVAGPIAALRWRDVAWPGTAELRAEQWRWGGGHTFLELSLRVAADAPGWRTQLASDIDHRGLKVDDDAVTKTEAVLRALL